LSKNHLVPLITLSFQLSALWWVFVCTVLYMLDKDVQSNPYAY